LDLSKLKLDIYDFVGIILPGLLAVAESWVLLRGWTAFVFAMTQIGGTGLTLLLIFAFGMGHIVQELGDVVIQFVKGKRYLRSARDRFWGGNEAKHVKEAIKKAIGHEIDSVDGSFDYCLTKLTGHFEKREIFVATSDLCRSLVTLAFLAILPACRIAFHDLSPRLRSLEFLALALALLVVVATLAWRRMMRFRELSEVTVFRAYLAVAQEVIPP
jgi:hypothetical protein